jgi:hypothetical protein
VIIYDSNTDGMKLRFRAGLALIGVAMVLMFASSKVSGTQIITNGSTLIYKSNAAPAVLSILASVSIFAAAFLMISTKVGTFRFFAALAILLGALALLIAVAEIQDHVIISDRSLTLDRIGFFSKSVELPYTDLQEAEFQSDKKQIVFYSKSRGAIYIPMGDLVMASIGKIRFALMSHGVEISNR